MKQLISSFVKFVFFIIISPHPKKHITPTHPNTINH